ncbi:MULTISPECIES: TIGR01777 family oxidoreductase [Aequorivita]|uniref:TIGR01777 family oxidoreductase n=1 Tax=Aequorivita iocasae TaxID=2803865 RepID=A0ABX7DTJ0_9FLAO|nr:MULTISPECIES: TIGR01777 family oxidoreductase [Aequorivita]QQX76868.1 TIGR01777 family oxidoreductase [Aequorivita iocasae]UCA56341.1 TIGR01777 family oxidoreductase [Aequorivita sp. F7]
MIKKVLITGATGLIGTELVRQCHREGISVNYLTTSKEKIENSENYKGFYWNPKKGKIDVSAFDGVTAVINLAGATISKRWTKKYKKVILDSRIAPINLLRDTLQNIDHTIVHFISASGISIYPNSETKLYSEEDEEVDDTFLGEVVLAWEAAAAQFKNMGMEVSKVRTGVVLAKDDGAFPQLVKPVKFGVGAPLGNGEQWLSWIHLEDIAGIYLFLLKNQLEGKYNAVAPNPVQNKKMTKMIASKLENPLWLPNIPAFAIKLFLGEMSVLVLEGQLVSSKKIEQLGYPFKYYNLDNALQDLL